MSRELVVGEREHPGAPARTEPAPREAHADRRSPRRRSAGSSARVAQDVRDAAGVSWRADPHAAERHALEAVPEEVAVLVRIRRDAAVENGSSRDEAARSGRSSLPKSSMSDPLAGRRRAARRVHAAGARAHDEHVGAHRGERVAMGSSARPAATCRAVVAPDATRVHASRAIDASRGRNSPANSGDASRTAAMVSRRARSAEPGRGRLVVASSGPTLQG